MSSIDDKRRINIQILRTKDTLTGSIIETASAEDITVLNTIKETDTLRITKTKPTVLTTTDKWLLPEDIAIVDPNTYTSESDEYIIVDRDWTVTSPIYFGKFAKSESKGIITGESKKTLTIEQSDFEKSLLNYGELLYLEYFKYLLIGDGELTVRQLVDNNIVYKIAEKPSFKDATLYGSTTILGDTNIQATAKYNVDLANTLYTKELSNTEFVQNAIHNAKNIFVGTEAPVLNRPVPGSSGYEYFAIWIDTTDGSQKIKFTEINPTTGEITWKEMKDLVLSVKTVLDDNPTKATNVNDKHIATTGYVKARIDELDYTPTDTLDTSRTITSLKQEDGKIAITAAPIKITYKQVVDAKKPQYSTADPLPNGDKASAGDDSKKHLYSREDHIHPHDSTKSDVTTTVTNVEYTTGSDTSGKVKNAKKFAKTVNGSSTPIVEIATIKSDMNLEKVDNKSYDEIRNDLTLTGTAKAPNTAGGTTYGVIATQEWAASEINKLGTFIFYQDETPTIPELSESVPRIWIHKTTGIMKVWNGSSWVNVYSIWH